MDLYECCTILNVLPSDNLKTIRRAYLFAVKKWHPDRFDDSGSLKAAAENNIRLINIAYETLRSHLKKGPCSFAHPSFQQSQKPNQPSDSLKESESILRKLIVASIIHIFFKPLASLLNTISPLKYRALKRVFRKPSDHLKKIRPKRKTFSTILLEVQMKSVGGKNLKPIYLKKNRYHAYHQRKKNKDPTRIEGISESKSTGAPERIGKIRGIPPI